MLGEIAKRRKEGIDFLGIWNAQKVDSILEAAIAIVAGVVNEEIISPPHGISNISEWCKRDACWTRLQSHADNTASLLSPNFFEILVSVDDQAEAKRDAKQTQRIDNSIEAQRRVLAISNSDWARIHQLFLEKGVLTPKQASVLNIAKQIPAKIPTEKQCLVLLDILDKGRAEG